jgi:hypothetical protein
MEHEVAFVELQLRVLDLLGATERGFAEIETVGRLALKASPITPISTIWINAKNRKENATIVQTILLYISALL